ncbi:protein DEFECTIVE IN MERISTEM SILENCING 3-like isoform X2 [Rutidosis leptorrhynchoides]|uniref:protein DEFECTIVE IN MERISTEM SILENCING 3-like isoform X2 n=1 Tax=Rutidosis leptorrhynchoides TaxID=125765 RepID=UPI003A98D9BC
MYSSSSQQIPSRPKVLSVQVPSGMNYAGQNESPGVANQGVQNGAVTQAETIVDPSKKLENDMMLLGKQIKLHEENIKLLKTHMHSLDDVITDTQVTLGKYRSSTAPMIVDEDLSQMQSENATIESIMKYEKSAAAIFCMLKRQKNQAAHIKDIIGVVATLGKVNDDNFSRLLSEYVGMDIMMILVCMTYDGVKGLVTYDNEGGINTSTGFYGLAAAVGQTLEGRINVICLENLRPYVGEYLPNDPQRRLDIAEPRLPNGETPPGFIGFAVNMIHMDNAHLFHLTHDGNGLRETLFYKLFSQLQVYKTRNEMLQALPFINDGAISLDGGIIKSNGVFCLGTREEMDVKFPITSGVSYLPEAYFQVEKEMKEHKWKKERLMEDIQSEEKALGEVKNKFEVKKQEFIGLMAQSSPYTMQGACNFGDKFQTSNSTVVGNEGFTNSREKNVTTRQVATRYLLQRRNKLGGSSICEASAPVSTVSVAVYTTSNNEQSTCDVAAATTGDHLMSTIVDFGTSTNTHSVPDASNSSRKIDP